jgi:hypothetical protein
LTCRKIIYAFAEVILCRSLRRPVKVNKDAVNFTKNHLIQITACILYLMNTVIALKHSLATRKSIQSNKEITSNDRKKRQDQS